MKNKSSTPPQRAETKTSSLASRLTDEMASAQYRHRDWFDSIIDALSNESAANQDAIRALIDPGHSAAVLRNAAPLPSPRVGSNVFTSPSVCTHDITVAVDTFVFTVPEPSIAFCTYTAGDTVVYAYPASHASAVTPYNPTIWMRERDYIGVRCTAKSLTIENTTPTISRGGYTLARRITPNFITRDSNFQSGTVALTTYGNMRLLQDIPLTASQFESGSDFARFGPDGAYLVCSLLSEHFDVADDLTKNVFQGMSGLGNPDTTNCNKFLVGTTDSLVGDDVNSTTVFPVVWANGTVLYMEGQTNATFATGFNDQMSTVIALLRPPAGTTQTYSVKEHVRNELLVGARSPDYPKSVAVMPYIDNFNKLLVLSAEMPGMYEASYNGGGKVWNAFKKGLSWVGNKIVKPTLGAALGGFKNAVSGALA